MSVAEEERRGDDEQGAGGGVDLPLSSKVKMLDQCFTIKMELLSNAICVLTYIHCHHSHDSREPPLYS